MLCGGLEPGHGDGDVLLEDLGQQVDGLGTAAGDPAKVLGEKLLVAVVALGLEQLDRLLAVKSTHAGPVDDDSLVSLLDKGPVPPLVERGTGPLDLLAFGPGLCGSGFGGHGGVFCGSKGPKWGNKYLFLIVFNF